MANKKLAAEARLYAVLRKAESLTEGEQYLLDTLEKIEGVKVTAEASGKSKAEDQAAEIAAAVDALAKADVFVLDLETQGTTGEEDDALDALTNRIEGVGVGVGKNKKDAWWFPFIPSYQGEQVYSQIQVFRALQPILKDPNKSFLNSNPKFDIKCLKVQGIDVENKIIDTVIADWLLDENQRRHGLKEIIEREYGIKTVSWAEAKRAVATPGNEGAFREYALNDVKFAFMAWEKLEKQLKKEPKLLKLFHEVEMELIPIFVELELEGVRIDRNYLDHPDPDFPNDPTKGMGLLQILNKEKVEAAARAKAALGRDIDISKSQQVSVVLFGVPSVEALRKAEINEKIIAKMSEDSTFFVSPPGLFPIPLDKKRQPILPGKNGYYSTDDGILSYLKGHPFIDALLDWRWADKMLSTYVTTFLEKSERTGTVHPDFNLAGAVTGRFCVSDKTILDTSMGICRISELHLTNEQEISIITHRGRPRKILGVYFLGREEMFRVTLNNGSWIEGTAGHRVETPYGWRSIYELSEGGEVFSPRDTARKGGDERAASCIAGRCFQEAAGRRRHVGVGVDQEVSDQPARVVHVEASVRGEVRGADPATASEPAFNGLDREPERGEKTSSDSLQGYPPVVSGCGVQSSGDGAEIGNERVFGSEESLALWAGPDGAVTPAHAGDGLRDDSSVGHAFPRASGGGEATSREPEGILQRPICCLCEAHSTSLVHSGAIGGLPASEGPKTPSKRSCMLEHEQGRDAAISISSRCGNTPCPPVFRGEVHGGLCLSGGEFVGGGGRGVPQDGCSYEVSGCKEGREDSGTRVEGSAFHDETSRDGARGSGFIYPTASIISIESVGEQDIWDIEVEEDHSFIANGFVNHNTCSNPSLHQIPTEKGKYSIKKSFVPDMDTVFICGDFGQIQFKIAGHFAKKILGKSAIADAYLAGSDLHTKTQTELHFKDRKPAKCVTGDTMVLFGDGWKRIGDVVPKEREGEVVDVSDGPLVVGDDKARGVRQFYYGGRQPVYEVVTRHGFRLEATPNHRFVVVRNGEIERVPLSELGLGKSVILKVGANTFGENVDLPEVSDSPRTSFKSWRPPAKLTPEVARFFGYFVSEGRCEHSRTSYNMRIGVYTEPKDVSDDILACSKVALGDRVSKHVRGKVTRVDASSKSICTWLRDLGCGWDSASKDIPGVIMSAPWEFQREFLRAMFQGDGSCEADVNGLVSITSKSESLVRNTQLILLNAGILSRLSKGERSGYGIFWRLDMDGEEMSRFRKIVGFVGKDKTEAVDRAHGSRKVWKSTRFLDGFEGVVEAAIGAAHGDLKERLRHCLHGVRLGESLINKIPCSVIPESMVHALRNGLWSDEIVSIRYAGEKDVFDVVEPEKKLFITNGILTEDTVNFGFIFGRMPDGFSYDNHIPIDDAKKFYNHFHKAYPELDQMYDWVKEELCEKGYVSSFTGRKRRFPKYKGLDPFKDAGKLWWDSRSTAWNAMVQGGEADVVRIAMRNIYRKIKAMRKVDPRWERVKLKAQVHDEMLYQAPKEIAEAVAAMVKHEAENCIKLVVPITFDMGVSSENWESAKP